MGQLRWRVTLHLHPPTVVCHCIITLREGRDSLGDGRCVGRKRSPLIYRREQSTLQHFSARCCQPSSSSKCQSPFHPRRHQTLLSHYRAQRGALLTRKSGQQNVSLRLAPAAQSATYRHHNPQCRHRLLVKVGVLAMRCPGTSSAPTSRRAVGASRVMLHHHQ